MKTEEGFQEAVWSCGPILAPSLIDLNGKVDDSQKAGEIDYQWRIMKLRKLTVNGRHKAGEIDYQWRIMKLRKLTVNGRHKAGEIDYQWRIWKLSILTVN